MRRNGKEATTAIATLTSSATRETHLHGELETRERKSSRNSQGPSHVSVAPRPRSSQCIQGAALQCMRSARRMKRSEACRSSHWSVLQLASTFEIRKRVCAHRTCFPRPSCWPSPARSAPRARRGCRVRLRGETRADPCAGPFRQSASGPASEAKVSAAQRQDGRADAPL